MTRTVSSSLASCLALATASLALPACVVEGSANGTLYTPPPPSAGATATIAVGAQPEQPAQAAVPAGTINVQAQVAVPANVVVMQPTCHQGAPEQCNGIDDNCNGAIDEGCGYQSGQIQVTAAWNSPSDIDLHVTDPAGERV